MGIVEAAVWKRLSLSVYGSSSNFGHGHMDMGMGMGMGMFIKFKAA